MALIGTIRKHSWILVVMVGLGLGGFIIMDVSSAGGLGGNTTFSVGEVNGQPIDWIEFQSAEEALYQNSSIDVYSRRDYLWDYFIEKQLVDDEAEAIGLSVGDEEMEELQYGTNISPVVQRNFSDPSTGQLNRQSLNEFRQAYDAGQLAPQFQRVWEYQAKEIAKERKQEKLLNIVKKGIYTPTWMAERIQNDVGTSIDFRYAMVPYDAIDNGDAPVSEDDFKAYIKAHSNEYTIKEERRDLSFVVFDVLPTANDTMLIREKIEGYIAEFADTEEDSIFAVNHFGGYDAAYLKKDDLPAAVADTAFKLETGQVYGPYIDEGSFWAIKALGRRVIPDSVRSRHILLSVQTQEQVQNALLMADSIESMLNKDLTRFDSLAQLYSGDQGSRINGGDLDFVAVNTFVKPMNDLLFYSDAQPGEVHRVLTQFGIHIVEVLERRFNTNDEGVKLASIREPIIPSDDTQDEMYDDVLEFAGLNRSLDALQESESGSDDITIEEAKNLSINGYTVGRLGAGNSSREIVRWLFDGDTKVGNVAPEVFIYEDPVNYFNAQYVVVALADIHEAGLAEPSQVMDLIEADVINAKKAEVIKERISGNSLNAVASQFDVPIDSVENVNFGIQFMRNIGEEPAVLGAATNMNVGQVSEPIVGRNGVFVIEITKMIPASLAQNMPRLRRQGAFQVQNAADFELLDAMRQEAKIKDMRNRFY